MLANCSLSGVVLINPKVELERLRSRLRLRSRFDPFVRMDEGNKVEFEEFGLDKMVELFSSVEARVEKAGLDEVRIKISESVKQEIMLYLTPYRLLRKCIKKIHRL
jgi:hypothetical protein